MFGLKGAGSNCEDSEMGAFHIKKNYPLFREGDVTPEKKIFQADPSPAQDKEEDFVAETKEMSVRFEIQRHLKL